LQNIGRPVRAQLPGFHGRAEDGHVIVSGGRSSGLVLMFRVIMLLCVRRDVDDKRDYSD